MRNNFLKHAIAIAGIALFPTLVAADQIGPNCGSCNGGKYTLFYSGSALADADPLHETFRITFEADTSGVAAVVPTAVAIDAASIKVANAGDITGASLFSAPVGVGSWNLLAGGVSNGGCAPNASNGFECADWVAAGVGASIGGILDWVFDITVDNGQLFTSLLGSSIKARFVDASGSHVGALLSENITLQVSSSSSSSSSGGTSGQIPEPSSSGLVAFGLGLIALGFAARRRSGRI